jgi:hypothetical protein
MVCSPGLNTGSREPRSRWESPSPRSEATCVLPAVNRGQGSIDWHRGRICETQAAHCTNVASTLGSIPLDRPPNATSITVERSRSCQVSKLATRGTQFLATIELLGRGVRML